MVGADADLKFYQPTFSNKPSKRLPLLSARPTIIFPASSVTGLGQYEVILLVNDVG